MELFSLTEDPFQDFQLILLQLTLDLVLFEFFLIRLSELIVFRVELLLMLTLLIDLVLYVFDLGLVCLTLFTFGV